MKKILLPLMSLFFVLAFNVGHANAVPDIRGEYSGTYTTVVSNCTDSEKNGTYNDVPLSMIFSNQTGDSFSGSATGTFNIDGFNETEYIQISGTITETGQISGITSHTFWGTGGEGTFTGQLSGNTLSIENPGHDTYGNTCTYIRYMSAVREEPPPLANFSAKPTSGNAPLNVNFTDETTGTITSWNWNFGDGASSNMQNPSHTYVNEGKYIVSLTASGPYGSDTETKTDFISIAGILDCKEFKILPNDEPVLFGFGGLSISGKHAIVGTPYDTYNALYSGSAYIFEKSGSSWNQVAKLLPSDGFYYGNFGRSVSISGEYAIVGAMEYSPLGTGVAYIFEKNGSGWNQVVKLTVNEEYTYAFGESVSISGDYAIVGAGENSLYVYIFERSGSSWNQVAKLTASDWAAFGSFGLSVSISGDYAIVGAHEDSHNGNDSGSAYIFEKSGSSWNQVAKLTASDRHTYDSFGKKVSISGDYAIVGSAYENENRLFTGVAYIFEKSGSDWNQVAKLTASDGYATDGFGESVSISGDYAIVGASADDDQGKDSGSAYIFKKSGSRWSQADKLTASDGYYDMYYFGESVSISGRYAIVSRTGGYPTGAAYIFDLSVFNPLPNSNTMAMPWIPLLLLDD